MICIRSQWSNQILIYLYGLLNTPAIVSQLYSEWYATIDRSNTKNKLATNVSALDLIVKELAWVCDTLHYSAPANLPKYCDYVSKCNLPCNLK